MYKRIEFCNDWEWKLIWEMTLQAHRPEERFCSQIRTVLSPLQEAKTRGIPACPVAGFQSKLQTLSVWPSSLWISFNSIFANRLYSLHTPKKHTPSLILNSPLCYFLLSHSPPRHASEKISENYFNKQTKTNHQLGCRQFTTGWERTRKQATYYYTVFGLKDLIIILIHAHHIKNIPLS